MKILKDFASVLVSLLITTAIMLVPIPAQQTSTGQNSPNISHVQGDVNVVAKPAPGKETPPTPAPITQAEKDAFHRSYMEYLEMQNKYATQMLQLKGQLADLEKKSADEVGPKSQAIQQMFNGLSARCVAPKVFDRMSADCQIPEAPKQP